MNTVLISTWLLHLAAFFMQRVSLGWLKNGLLASAIFVILQLSLLYQEALGLLLHFLAFFIFSYLHTKSVGQTVLYSSLPLLNLSLINSWTSQFSLSLWPNFAVTIGLLVLASLLEQLLLKKLPTSIQSNIYLLPLLILLWLYYQQMLGLFDYLFVGQDTRLDIFKGILAAVMLLFLFTVVLVHRNEAQVIYQEQLKARTQIDREYLQLTTQQYNEMRKFRHDYQNILLSIEGFIREEAWQELTNYFHSELSTQLATDNQQFERLILLENANLRQILYAKLAAAQVMNVNVQLELTEVIAIHHPDQLTLSRMLGIILDNAIEEVGSLDNDASVTVAFIKESEATIILVVNDCRSQMEPFLILAKEGFSSKGDGRGFGLANLASLQARTDILVNTEIVSGIFKQEIIVPEWKDGVGL